MTKTVLITGGLGFVMSNFVNKLRRSQPEWNIIILDNESYAANRSNIDHYLMPLHTWKESRPKLVTAYLKADVAWRSDFTVLRDVDIDVLIHGAAETHVDNSIVDPNKFVMTNVMGTTNMLDLVRHKKIKRSIFIETDEVYGDSAEKLEPFCENDLLNPTSPYASSKAAASLMTSSYVKTYDMGNLLQLRPTNMYGPRQHPEKLIPKIISCLKSGEVPKLYGDGSQLRNWLYIDDFCELLESFIDGRWNIDGILNVSGRGESTNTDVLAKISEIMGIYTKPEFIDDPRGRVSDKRYWISDEKIKFFGSWEPKVSLYEGLKRTVEYYGR